MDDNRILKIAFTSIAILSVISFINQSAMRKELKQEIVNLNGQIAGLQGQLNNQTSNINNALNQFKEESKWVSSSGYKFLGYNTDTGLIKTEVSWSFREISPKSVVYLSYGEFNQSSNVVDKWNSIKAVKGEDSLNYMAEISLAPNKVYKFKILGENSSGARGEEILNIDINSSINNRIEVFSGIYGYMGPRYENHGYVMNNHNGQKFLMIKSAKAEIYVKGVLEKTIELHAAKEEITKDMLEKFPIDVMNREVWLNDEAIWIKGEENWVESGNNSWNYKGDTPLKSEDVRIEITIVDNMGKTYLKTLNR